MILRAYSVLDLKAQAYAAPFFLHKDALAIRSFSDAVADPQHPMSRHAEDYQLYYIGEFDDAAGAFSPVAPVFLMNGLGEVSNG